MGAPVKQQKLIDDKWIFEQYFLNPDVQAGNMSYNKIYEMVKRKFGKNPNTGADFTKAAIWHSANRYFVRNYDNPEIEAAYNMWYVNSGLAPLTHEEYLHEVSKRARSVFAKVQYRNWCAKHDDIEYLG